MGLVVKDIAGGEAPFSRTRFAGWVGRSFQLNAPAARKIARATHRELLAGAKEAKIGAPDLIVTAARLSVRYAAAGGLALSTRSIASILPAISPTDAIGPALQGIGALVEYFKERGFVEDGPGYMKKEEVGFIPPFDDQKAPDIQNLVFDDPKCCKSSMGSPGIEFRIKVQVTDSGGVGNSSGVKTVRVCAIRVLAGGRIVQSPCTEKNLTDSESEQSEDGWIDVELRLCVPCQFIREGGVDLAVRVIDDDENERICLATADIPPEKQRECCGGP